MPSEIPSILGDDASRSRAENGASDGSQPSKHGVPPGMIMGKDGKPCRTCNSGTAFRAWAATARKVEGRTVPADKYSAAPPSTTARLTSLPDDCPADVENLGRSTWTFLHTLAATYPEAAVPSQQDEMKTFMSIFSRIYPCWVCADDFQAWMRRPENQIDRFLGTRDMFGMWMCMAHNDVNRKLGKQEFDCLRWKERWQDGWKDGRCG